MPKETTSAYERLDRENGVDLVKLFKLIDVMDSQVGEGANIPAPRLSKHSTLPEQAPSPFMDEGTLRQLITSHIVEFTREILGDHLVDYHEEYPLGGGQCSPRVDLFVQGKAFNHIIELKNPNDSSKNRNGVAQLLDYGRRFIEPNKKLWLVTTLHDLEVQKTIDYYGLPITYIYIGGKAIMKFSWCRGD